MEALESVAMRPRQARYKAALRLDVEKFRFYRILQGRFSSTSDFECQPFWGQLFAVGEPTFSRIYNLLLALPPH